MRNEEIKKVNIKQIKMNSKFYKGCAVPLCNNTSKRTPKKVFVHVPTKKVIRDKWLKLAGRNPNDVATNAPLYFCEDHFDLPNDMENYMQYHLMGSVSQVRMKPGCMPHKFTCQPDRRPRTSDKTEQPYIAEKRRMMILEECKNDFEGKVIVTEQSNFEGIASGSSDGESLLIPRVKQENDSDFDNYTEAGQAFTPNIIEVELTSRNDDGAGLLIPPVKQENDSDFDDYTGDKDTILPVVMQENDSDYDNTDDEDFLIPMVKLEYGSDGDEITGNDTDSVYGSGAPGPSTEEELRADIVGNECWTTYSRQDFKPSETESTDNESRRLNKAPKTAAERMREYRQRKNRERNEIRKLEERMRSAEAKRRWREKKRAMSGLQKTQAKTAAERMREYRQRERKRALSGLSRKQTKTATERMREYREKKRRERESGQDLDAIVRTSSQVNQVAGPSTVNSISAEHTQCTVCNRLWYKDNLSKEVTNINNINGAVICPTCEGALDEQRPVDEQLGDKGTLSPHVKQENENDFDANTDEAVLISVVKMEYESEVDKNTGNDTDCVYGSGAPGSSIEKELRTDIVDNKCVTTYLTQDFKPSETDSTDNESRRKEIQRKKNAEYQKKYRLRQKNKKNETSIEQKVKKTSRQYQKEYRQRIKEKNDASADNIRRLNLAQRQRNHRMRRKDNENIDKIFRMKEALRKKEYRHKLKCSQLNAVLIQNEGNDLQMLNKAPKTAAERAREFRARKALLKQQLKQQQEQDNQVPKPPEIRIIEKGANNKKPSEKQAKTPAERLREYRQRKKRERERAQYLLEAIVRKSSQVNQVAGPSTINSTSAEHTQCTVCNRLWYKDDLSKEVTNINNINGAVICPTCEGALDEQRPADEQLEAGQACTKNFIEVEVPSRNDDDEDFLIPMVKLEYGSDGDDNTESRIEGVIEKDQLCCPVCQETFPDLVNLNMHMNVHYPNHICDGCGKAFTSKARLKGHLRTHQDTGVFPCKFCDAVFDNMINKENHVSKEHKSGDVKCNKCNMSLPSFFESQKHLVEVHKEMVKRYKCKACTKSFITPGHLSSHVRKDHFNQRNDKCTKCHLYQ